MHFLHHLRYASHMVIVKDRDQHHHGIKTLNASDYNWTQNCELETQLR